MKKVTFDKEVAKFALEILLGFTAIMSIFLAIDANRKSIEANQTAENANIISATANAISEQSNQMAATSIAVANEANNISATSIAVANEANRISAISVTANVEARHTPYSGGMAVLCKENGNDPIKLNVFHIKELIFTNTGGLSTAIIDVTNRADVERYTVNVHIYENSTPPRKLDLPIDIPAGSARSLIFSFVANYEKDDLRLDSQINMEGSLDTDWTITFNSGDVTQVESFHGSILIPDVSIVRSATDAEFNCHDRLYDPDPLTNFYKELIEQTTTDH